MDDSTRIRLLHSYYRTALAPYASFQFYEQFRKIITDPIFDCFAFQVLGPDELEIITQRTVLRGVAVVMPLNDTHKDSYMRDFFVSAEDCDLDGVSQEGLSQIVERSLKSSLKKKEVRIAYFNDRKVIEAVDYWLQDLTSGLYKSMFV